MRFIIALYSLILACLTLSTPSFAAEQTLEELNNAAHFLVGLEMPHPGFEDLAESKAFKYQKTRLDKEWAEHAKRTLEPISKWTNGEVSPHSQQGGVVRYMFSGPDILHALQMFPKADTFVMCGLEPVGVAPDIRTLTPGDAGRALSEVRHALEEIINYSFFRTKDMKTDLRFAMFSGTTPIMMGFLARSGQHLNDYEFFKLQKDGTLESQGTESKGADAVKIDFSAPKEEKSKTLYYFSTNLSDSGFSKNGFEKWLTSQPKGDSYLKAASFLLHSRSRFSDVRNHLLTYSVQIVQDDSGIPYRYFDKDNWDIHLYGTYSGPIDIFSQFYQSDLKAAYGRKRTVLDFGTGYKWRKRESNLMRFVAKESELRAVPVTEKKE